MTRAKQQGITINSNTIIGLVTTLIGGVILYMVTNGLGQVKQTGADVREVKTVLPFMQRSIDTAQADIKDVKNTAVTRTELDNKHNRLQESLKDLKGDVKEVQNEQKQVRQDLMKQQVYPRKEKEPNE